MNMESELQQRERLARHWSESETAVRAFVHAAIPQFADAEDVVQQVALTVTRRFEEYDGRRPFVAWALWLAKSRLADHWRRIGRERLVFSEEVMDRMAAALEEQQPERTARQEALEHCIDKLPAKSRQLLDLRYAEARSAEEIARETHGTPGSVRVLLHRVRSLLADCLAAQLRRDCA
ncbi:MAG: sigma-70 family RNA polymerase sigma factor [Verrucomicrobiales bacterium]|nr:sigma-70 family RNA polymerase sigma factor [Verrucomicrobiales bacterium]